jgi:hypothetical protein
MDIYYIKNSFQNIIDSNLHFINLHYLSRYISIISKFKERNLVKKENPGFHRHHIVPRCIKGSNEKKNLVTLSPREHFIVHHLLWKAFPQTGLTFSFRSMVHGTKKYGSNKITSRVYEQLCLDNKERGVSDETKKRMSEAQKGKKHSEETRRKISEANKRENLSEETRRKMSKSQKGKILSDEHRLKISESIKGQKRSLETRRKMSDANKGRKVSEETRKKLSEAGKKENISEESRLKRSESQKNKPKTFWVCSPSESRMIQKDLLEGFLSNGYILGRKFK